MVLPNGWNKNMECKVKSTKLLMFTVVISLSLTACAGWLNTMKDTLQDRLTYQIQVVDEAGIEISGATIWYTGISDDLDWEVVYQRLFKRYSTDFDYARVLNLMDTRIQVEFTDVNGQRLLEWKTGETPKMAFAILKRGYLPQVFISQSELNIEQSLIFKLKSNIEYTINEKMEKFDQLRADIFNSRELGMMTEARQKYIIDKQDAMRKLALELEDEHPELAARIYLNLSDLPSVDSFIDPDGKKRIKGFSNGYDYTDPKRHEDFEKGLFLDKLTPEILSTRIIFKENNSNILMLTAENKLSLMKDNALKVQQVVDKYPNRVWPNTYLWLIYRYENIGENEKACQTLKLLYSFEPAVNNSEDWESLRSYIGQCI